MTTKLTPQEQAEQERLQRILDELNGQIDSIIATMENDIAIAMRAAAQKSLRPAIRRVARRSATEMV